MEELLQRLCQLLLKNIYYNFNSYLSKLCMAYCVIFYKNNWRTAFVQRTNSGWVSPMSSGLTHQAPSSTQRDLQFSPAIAPPPLERRPRREGLRLPLPLPRWSGALAAKVFASR